MEHAKRLSASPPLGNMDAKDQKHEHFYENAREEEEDSVRHRVLFSTSSRIPVRARTASTPASAPLYPHAHSPSTFTMADIVARKNEANLKLTSAAAHIDDLNDSNNNLPMTNNRTGSPQSNTTTTSPTTVNHKCSSTTPSSRHANDSSTYADITHAATRLTPSAPAGTDANDVFLDTTETPAENDHHQQQLDSALQQFYDRKNVFVTGGTGFMGKMLIDKLLRTCPGIENIYLLVRPKKGKDIHTRLDEIFDDQVFAVLRETVPKFRHKIVALAGDCGSPGLGLSITDRHTLIAHANIVFHAAATVRFDEKLKLAVSINVQGTRELLELCAQMAQLTVCMHVSTAYANCHMRFIEEKFYRYPFHYTDLNRLIEKLDDRALEEVTPTILGKWPNTYAFTKALAESVVRQNGGRMPIGMFRPAIVTSSVREPVVGWIDNLYGPTGVVAGVGTGVLRTMHCDRDVVANIVPVDMTVNALIAAAWDVAVNHKVTSSTDDIPVYNYVSSVEKRLTWGEFNDLHIRNGFDYPFSSAIWYLSFHTHKYALTNKIYMLFLHYLPALLIDALALCAGQRPQLLRMYKKIHKFSDVISYFCTNEWIFTNDNVQRLWRRLPATDRRMFDFNMRDMDWVEYSYHYIKGMRLYLFKDDLSTIPAARRKWNRLYWMHQILKAVLAMLLLYVLYKMFAALVL